MSLGARVRAVVLAGAVAACTQLPVTPSPGPTMAVAEALSHPDRPADDRARDAASRPADVLRFFGVVPGIRVLDMNAATGWYTEILARVVGPAGHVIAHNHPGARDALAAEDFARRYGGDRLPNVEQVFVRHNDLRLPAESLDAVLMSMVYHDTYWHDDDVDWGPVDRGALLAALYRALKSGGIVGVIDHYAAPGSDAFESVMALHRIDPAVVRRDFAAAGFEEDGASDVLRNPSDDYAASVFDPAVVGRTDRFVLRYLKPGNGACR